MATLVVEHLEPVVSPWVYLEYKHAAKVAGGLLITNVKRDAERSCLEAFADVTRESIGEIAERGEILVLDPQAAAPLSPSDFESFEYIVVGGIMGDFPPRGRTRTLLTEKLGAEARNLGPCQLSVDGAVYVASRVAQGAHLSSVEVAMGLVLRRGCMELHLPYCYPVAQEGVLFSRELAIYLLTLLEEDEAHAVETNRARSIADYGCWLELPNLDYELTAGRIARLGELMGKSFIPAL